MDPTMDPTTGLTMALASELTRVPPLRDSLWSSLVNSLGRSLWDATEDVDAVLLRQIVDGEAVTMLHRTGRKTGQVYGPMLVPDDIATCAAAIRYVSRED